METTVLVCVKEGFGGDRPSCAQRGSVALAHGLEEALTAQGVAVPVTRLYCFGRCNTGPVMRVAPGGPFFTGMTQERLGEVVQAAQAALLEAEENPPETPAPPPVDGH
ncbi:MAG: (2Fe-2S) ferredoxin domain-containing protein [Magnetococcus sp. XQGC-1]